MVSTKMYIDTTDKRDTSRLDAIKTAKKVADFLEEYLIFRGCTDVHANLTKYGNIIFVTWYPRRCAEADIWDEMVDLCYELETDWSDNLKDLCERVLGDGYRREEHHNSDE